MEKIITNIAEYDKVNNPSKLLTPTQIKERLSKCDKKNKPDFMKKNGWFDRMVLEAILPYAKRIQELEEANRWRGVKELPDNEIDDLLLSDGYTWKSGWFTKKEGFDLDSYFGFMPMDVKYWKPIYLPTPPTEGE